ncbi:hypothetical protein D3C74_110110 [compost metagenome]
MHFKLDDGKPVWAIATTLVESETIYLYEQSELAEQPNHVLLDPPTQDILIRVAQIEGKTLSRSEFERLLNEKTSDELIQEQNAQLLLANADHNLLIQEQQQQIAALLIQVAQLSGGIKA